MPFFQHTQHIFLSHDVTTFLYNVEYWLYIVSSGEVRIVFLYSQFTKEQELCTSDIHILMEKKNKLCDEVIVSPKTPTLKTHIHTVTVGLIVNNMWVLLLWTKCRNIDYYRLHCKTDLVYRNEVVLFHSTVYVVNEESLAFPINSQHMIPYPCRYDVVFQ